MKTADALQSVYLEPGDFCFGEGHLRISTLLGSCVSIILWHPRFVHGGMCHYMLPSRGKPRGDLEPDGKYADEAMELFMQEIKKRHTDPVQYRVSIYGGGNMFRHNVATNMDIGQQNIETARRLLDQYGFAVADSHLGSFGHRKIAFDVWSGEIRLSHVEHNSKRH